MEVFPFTTLLLALGCALGPAVGATEPGNQTKRIPGSSWTPGICDRAFPEEVKQDFPVFLTGYDFEERPVLFWEMGMFKYSKYAESNETTLNVAYDYFENIWCRISNLTSPHEDAETGVTVVANLAGFDTKQLLSVEVTKMNLEFARLAEKSSDNVADVVLINTSFVTEAWINLIRPVAGRFVGRIELAGNRKDKWLAILAGKMERSVIPAWIRGDNAEQGFDPKKIW